MVWNDYYLRYMARTFILCTFGPRGSRYRTHTYIRLSSSFLRWNEAFQSQLMSDSFAANTQATHTCVSSVLFTKLFTTQSCQLYCSLHTQTCLQVTKKTEDMFTYSTVLLFIFISPQGSWKTFTDVHCNQILNTFLSELLKFIVHREQTC